MPERVGGESGGSSVGDTTNSQLFSLEPCVASARILTAPPMKMRAANNMASTFLFISSPLLIIQSSFLKSYVSGMRDS
jgi:hypothetical protein